MADDQSKPKTKSAKKPAGVVFDVRRPGKAPAPPTSRPVIVGHKPEAQLAQAAVSGVGEANPMLARRKIQITPSGEIQSDGSEPKHDEAAPEEKARDIPEEEKEALAAAALDAVTGPPDLSDPQEEPEDGSDTEKEDRPTLFTKPKLVIKPPSEEQGAAAQPADEAEPEPKELVPEEPEIRANKDAASKGTEELVENGEEQSAAKAEEQSPTEGDRQPAPSETEESAAAPTEGAQEPTPAEGEGTEQAEEKKPEPHIEPLFDEHGTIVSHRSHHRRGHGLKVFALLLVALILAAAILDILLDLEILNLEGIPHTGFL